jgi:hypothetical protein
MYGHGKLMVDGLKKAGEPQMGPPTQPPSLGIYGGQAVGGHGELFATDNDG